MCALLDDHKSRGSGLAPWPARLTAAPPRLADFGYSKDIFEKDTVIETVLPCLQSFSLLGSFSLVHCEYVSKCNTHTKMWA